MYSVLEPLLGYVQLAIRLQPPAWDWPVAWPDLLFLCVVVDVVVMRNYNVQREYLRGAPTALMHLYCRRPFCRLRPDVGQQ